MTTINPTLDAVQAAIATAIEAQPWYRRFANTVNASLGGVAGALATLAAAYAATGRADSTAVLVGAAAAITAGIAARLTKNGVTPSTGEAITAVVAAQTAPRRCHRRRARRRPRRARRPRHCAGW